MKKGGHESLRRFERLLHPGPWDGLPPVTRSMLEGFRRQAAETGLERGILTKVAKRLNKSTSNVSAVLVDVLARAHRWDALHARRDGKAKAIKARGYTSQMPGMQVTKITDQTDADGNITSSSYRQELEPINTLADPGNPLPGFVFKRISSAVSGGEVRTEWQIQEPQKAAMWQQICDAIDERVLRIPARPAAPAILKRGAQQLLGQLTFADLHVGALGWSPETGAAPWDLKIARESALAAGSFLIRSLPQSEELLFLSLGDYLDTDGYSPVTPASKHQLDVDGRFPKISDVGSEIIEILVEEALERFEVVRLVVQPGNHDPLSAQWMRKVFIKAFRSEPRVIVETGVRNTYVQVFGKTMVAATHGDRIRFEDIPTVMACDYAEEWGQTTHRFGHAGHLHHTKTIKTFGYERNGMEVYQHPTIASRTAWAAGLGLSAARQLVAHSYRREGGLAGKLFWHPDMMERRAA